MEVVCQGFKGFVLSKFIIHFIKNNLKPIKYGTTLIPKYRVIYLVLLKLRQICKGKVI